MFQLTPHQIDFMDTFGFLHFAGLLKDKIADIDQAFEELMRENGGHQHDGLKRFCVAPCINHSAYLCTLLDDDRIHGIATGLLGEQYQYWNSDGNYYVAIPDGTPIPHGRNPSASTKWRSISTG